MRRRKVIALIGGAAAWPLAARARQRERTRRIGVLMHLAADDPEGQRRVASFLQGLQERDWAVGRNVDIDMRWAAGEAERFRRYAMEIIALTPDVILASATLSVLAVQQATRTVPIVFVLVPDAVGTGIVASLSRPGGNATGFTSTELGMSVKWLELLKQIAPKVTRAAVLRDAADPAAMGQLGAIRDRHEYLLVSRENQPSAFSAKSKTRHQKWPPETRGGNTLRWPKFCTRRLSHIGEMPRCRAVLSGIRMLAGGDRTGWLTMQSAAN